MGRKRKEEEKWEGREREAGERDAGKGEERDTFILHILRLFFVGRDKTWRSGQKLAGRLWSNLNVPVMAWPYRNLPAHLHNQFRPGKCVLWGVGGGGGGAAEV